MKELMINNKLVIGMVHFPALPGSASFDDDSNLSKTLDLNVNNIQTANYHIDPIDSLQILYDNWYLNNLDYILGDVNQDLNIDILDVIVVINIILDLHTPNIIEILSSDINEDEIINIQDIIILLAIILDD